MDQAAWDIFTEEGCLVKKTYDGLHGGGCEQARGRSRTGEGGCLSWLYRPAATKRGPRDRDARATRPATARGLHRCGPPRLSNVSCRGVSSKEGRL